MKSQKSLTITDLMEKTDAYRDLNTVIPDKSDPRIPESIFKYNPVIWEEDKGVWHTLLGSMPEERVWTMGTSPLESMIQFDKELKYRLKENGIVEDIPEKQRQEIHKEVFKKIDKMFGWKKER